MFKFTSITKVAVWLSIVLWVCATLLYKISFASFAIVSILAVFAQMIALQSAKREGVLNEKKRMLLVDDLLDEVGK